MGRLANMNRPAAVEIVYERMRFLITHNPTNATLNKFTEELKKFEVNTLVRVCDATYDKAPVEKEGIQVLVTFEYILSSYDLPEMKICTLLSQKPV
uniref:Protein tyrosine phosphatase 4A2b n=1 Tax=Astatotilapia calliptera TaxID=8154 RepID=A0AAX7VU73_ASTCA